MGLPREVIDRIHGEGDLVALRMKLGNREKDFYFLVKAKELPNNLTEFSLGSATALAVAGTDWDDIQDSASRYQLEPEYEDYLYQIFYGISPSYARIYRNYPTNVDIGSLIGTRVVGGAVGFINGEQSPLLSPSALTEFWTLKGNHPSFMGYHPYAEPSSITVRMTFYVAKFLVEYLKTPTEEQKKTGR